VFILKDQYWGTVIYGEPAVAMGRYEALPGKLLKKDGIIYDRLPPKPAL
jgi:hypothetical protein